MKEERKALGISQAQPNFRFPGCDDRTSLLTAISCQHFSRSMHVKSRLFHSLFGLTFVFAAVLVEAGSLVIPAWSFERGNVRVDADPAGFADAGPVVVSGPVEDWGWTVEYDVDIPVEAAYTIQICYASAESRPVNVRVDSKWVGSACDRVTFGPMSSGDAAAPSWKSSGAQWDLVTHQGKIATVWEKNLLAKGKHTLKLTRRQPLPHIVALRLETEAEFPADWQPPRFKVRDMDRIPAKHREAFLSQEGVQAALPPTLVLPKTNASGSLVIPAHTFDRGNARIHANPAQYALSGTLTGDGPLRQGTEQGDEAVVEYDIDFPVTAEYTLQIRYAAVEVRPTEVFLDGRKLGRICTGTSHHTANYVRPHEFPVNSKITKSEGLCDSGKGTLLQLPITRNSHAETCPARAAASSRVTEPRHRYGVPEGLAPACAQGGPQSNPGPAACSLPATGCRQHGGYALGSRGNDPDIRSAVSQGARLSEAIVRVGG
jgi:hypothetical protein